VTERPRVRIHYRRPPDREQIFDQIVVMESDDVIVTLSEGMVLDAPMRVEGDVVLETRLLGRLVHVPRRVARRRQISPRRRNVYRLLRERAHAAGN
jgi:hypothetical protein